ncbi:hypothetical protein ACFOWX_09825 [Sphingorhabdus arenilitoris]|uniref:DUF805 domain-containing protein n=1 Tax=Sphingorhabdus arenilitoris TaxID=1490041 RepID=A0ABV8RHG3_9SPHN
MKWADKLSWLSLEPIMSIFGLSNTRISRTAYWMTLLACIMLQAVILFGAGVSAIIGPSQVAVVGMTAIIIFGLAFHIVMMLRCRDIGWPILLPWVSLAVSLASLAAIFSIVRQDFWDSDWGIFGLFLWSQPSFAFVIGLMPSKAEFAVDDIFDRDAGRSNERPNL